MPSCVRTGCQRQSLAPWWALCVDCTAPLLTPVTPLPGDVTPAAGRADGDRPAVVADGAVTDQRAAAGWDALDWAERIAPRRWGSAATDDPWVTSVRCLVLASVVTGRADGCEHTGAGGATPVVSVVRAAGVLKCPACAEPVVSTVTTDGHACDRCGRRPVTSADRVAAVAGASLVVVAQLCHGCAGAVLALGVEPA